MNKLVVAFMLAFFFSTLLSAIADGGSSAAATRLTVAATDASTTLTVRSTQGFKDTGWIEIEDERIGYNGVTSTTFTNCTRGYKDTVATSHTIGTIVYSPETGIINAALGFTVVNTGATAGTISMMTFPVNFITKTIPKLVTWDFNYLKEGDAVYMRYFLWCISAGFVFSMTYLILAALGGVAQRIFVRP
jgi:hypothetical protein